MALLSAQDILQVDDRKYEVVPVPEWSGEVRLRTLTGKERDHFESSLQERRGGKVKDRMENFRARLIALCAVDQEGKLLFASAGQVTALGEKSVAALQRLFDKCNEMNGISEKDVEDMVEDFEPEAEEASTSD